MIEIRPLIEFNADLIRELICGYVSNSVFAVRLEDSDEKTVITIERQPLSIPHTNQMQPNEESITFYADLVEEHFSLAAYDEGKLVAVGLAEPRRWNRSLWIWEFHVAKEYQGQGVGRLLMDALAEKARRGGLRVMVAETQNTNTAAIAFYRRLGFALEGVDVSYYTNADMQPGGEVAFFMKRRLE